MSWKDSNSRSTEEELAVFDRIANLEITTEEAREIFREKLAGKKEAEIV